MNKIYPTKERKLNWFDRWFLKRSQKAWCHQQASTGEPIQEYHSNIDQPDRAIRFTIYHANGGRVVEFARYDRVLDRSVSGLYIIGNNQDFGKEIDKILTVEALKR